MSTYADIAAALAAPFDKDRVSWRASQLTKDGTKAMALAYIDARDVMERLDAVVGIDRWQNRYSFDGSKTICEIGIAFEINEWVWKADGAGDTDVEAEKGALSDAFKRAAVRWGIGRYLYELPSPWVPCESYESGGKARFKKFTVDPWTMVREPKAPPKPPVQRPSAETEAAGKPAGRPEDKDPTDFNVEDPEEWLAFERDLLQVLGTMKTVNSVERLWKMHKDRMAEMKTRYSLQWEGIASKFRAKKAELSEQTQESGAL